MSIMLTHALYSPVNAHPYSHVHVVDSPVCPCSHTREHNKHLFYWAALCLQMKELQCLTVQVIYILMLWLETYCMVNTENSEEVNIKAFEVIPKFCFLTLVGYDVNYIILLWLFCTDEIPLCIKTVCLQQGHCGIGPPPPPLVIQL